MLIEAEKLLSDAYIKKQVERARKKVDAYYQDKTDSIEMLLSIPVQTTNYFLLNAGNRIF